MSVFGLGVVVNLLLTRRLPCLFPVANGAPFVQKKLGFRVRRIGHRF